MGYAQMSIFCWTSASFKSESTLARDGAPREKLMRIVDNGSMAGELSRSDC